MGLGDYRQYLVLGRRIRANVRSGACVVYGTVSLPELAGQRREYVGVHLDTLTKGAYDYVHYLDVVPLCAACAGDPDVHDELTGKCLFGAGTWS